MSKLPKKLRVAGHKFSTAPSIEELLHVAADRIEELEKKLELWEESNAETNY